MSPSSKLSKELLVSLLVFTALVHRSWSGTGNKKDNMASGRNVIVQMLEWRWADIAAECENFLGPYGYGGVQVSPASENIIINDPPRPWYERYQPVSYEIYTRSGDEAAFTDMVQRCNAANVRIYVDGVFNHMTGSGVGQGTGIAGNHYDSNTETFDGVPYSSADFHSCDQCPQYCDIQNYNDAAEVRDCQLSDLLDLDQSQSNVRERISDYVNKLTSIGVAGFRLDAAKHMWPEDLSAIIDNLNDLPTSVFPAGSKPYIYQEVIDMGGEEAVHYYDYTDIGDVTEFEYGCQLAACFRNQNPMGYLDNWGEGWGLMPSGDALAFIDNHDTQRGNGPCGMNTITFFEPRIYKLITAFELAHPYGDPIRIMSSYRWERDIENGQDLNNWIGPPHDSNYNTLPVTFNADLSCQGDWVCEHSWRQIYNMVRFRNVVDGTAQENWWSNGDTGYQIAFSRGNKGFLVINNEPNTDLNQSLQTGMPAGDYCDVITGNLENGACTGLTVTVNGDGTAYFSISHTSDDPMVAIHADAKL